MKGVRGVERDLRRLSGVVTITKTARGHFRLHLSNGRFVITARSSEWRAFRNTLAQVRRELNGKIKTPATLAGGAGESNVAQYNATNNPNQSQLQARLAPRVP
jgi:hypothetical protein